jgi:hypothetical protein
MSDPVETLRAFGAAIEQGKPTVAADLFAPDATYEEPPAPILLGRAALLAFFTDFANRHEARLRGHQHPRIHQRGSHRKLARLLSAIGIAKAQVILARQRLLQRIYSRNSLLPAMSRK